MAHNVLVMSPPADDYPSVGDPHGTGQRHERIRVETARHQIEGALTLAHSGYRSRVSDVLNASERDFLTLTDVTVEPLDGGPVERYPFLAVARAHIIYVIAPVPQASA